MAVLDKSTACMYIAKMLILCLLQRSAKEWLLQCLTKSLNPQPSRGDGRILGVKAKHRFPKPIDERVSTLPDPMFTDSLAMCDKKSPNTLDSHSNSHRAFRLPDHPIQIELIGVAYRCMRKNRLF
mmetsp:Transcript_46139/g.86084  ORF Transcript_46139/g.86084 Transcript_46139/m.86084 type:complete len:125 (-) Transcript_46139:980-1354(-)